MIAIGKLAPTIRIQIQQEGAVPCPCVRCHLIAAGHWPDAWARWPQLASVLGPGCLVEGLVEGATSHLRGLADPAGADYSYTYSVW